MFQILRSTLFSRVCRTAGDKAGYGVNEIDQWSFLTNIWLSTTVVKILCFIITRSGVLFCYLTHCAANILMTSI